MRRPLVPLAVFGLLALVAFAVPAEHRDGETVLELSRLNGVHTNLAPDVAPIERGPVTIRVSSPSHRLAVHGNKLSLQPRDDGQIDAAFSVTFEGEGHLVAELDAGMSSRFEDEVQVPHQTLDIAGTIRLRQAEGGFDIILEDMPEAVEIAIESRALGQLVDLCGGLARVFPLQCDDLARELSNARIPMPPPGESVFLPDAYLTDDERRTLARLVSE